MKIDFLGNILISWIKASENNKEDSFKFLDRIPERYHNLKKIQNSFLQCYFDTPETQVAFEQLIGNEDFTFSRYNFFLANYLLFKNKNIEAKKIINLSRKNYNSNLLLEQAENFILTENSKKIKNKLNFKLNYNMKDGLYQTVSWYINNKNWLLQKLNFIFFLKKISVRLPLKSL